MNVGEWLKKNIIQQPASVTAAVSPEFAPEWVGQTGQGESHPDRACPIGLYILKYRDQSAGVVKHIVKHAGRKK